MRQVKTQEEHAGMKAKHMPNWSPRKIEIIREKQYLKQ